MWSRFSDVVHEVTNVSRKALGDKCIADSEEVDVVHF